MAEIDVNPPGGVGLNSRASGPPKAWMKLMQCRIRFSTSQLTYPRVVLPHRRHGRQKPPASPAPPPSFLRRLAAARAAVGKAARPQGQRQRGFTLVFISLSRRGGGPHAGRRRPPRSGPPWPDLAARLPAADGGGDGGGGEAGDGGRIWRRGWHQRPDPGVGDGFRPGGGRDGSGELSDSVGAAALAVVAVCDDDCWRRWLVTAASVMAANLQRPPVLAPLSPDGRRRQSSVASLLEDVVLTPPCCRAISSRRPVTFSGGRSGANFLSWSCVLALPMAAGMEVAERLATEAGSGGEAGISGRIQALEMVFAPVAVATAAESSRWGGCIGGGGGLRRRLLASVAGDSGIGDGGQLAAAVTEDTRRPVTFSGGRSGANFLSWSCVLALPVCGWWYIFFSPGYDPPGL
uniref:Uncharacterized protein n=1 Tax=Oryza meridionalis TaxID=40149 RepID=A0A0E0F3X5_9ORYZ